MAKTPTSEAVDSIQTALSAKLKPLGFRRGGRTFRRVTDDGLTQVINLQMTSFTSPGDLTSSFTVNLGVFVPEVSLHVFPDWPEQTPVQEGHCCFRVRLGGLTAANRDIWWETDAPELAARQISDLLDRVGFAYLERYSTRAKILQDLMHTAYGPNYTLERVSGSGLAAIILVHLGDPIAARRLLSAAVERVEQIPGPRLRSETQAIAAYHSLAKELGLPSLLLP